MALKVGLVPGLGFEPFYWDMRRRGIELSAVAPQDLAGAVESADVDAGPVSLVDSFRLEDQLQPISGFCVAAVQRAVNSLLFAQRPLEELSGLPIAAADADPTSVSLLNVLMSIKLGIEPGVVVSAQEPHEAVLMTGDPALRRRRGLRGFPHRYDLGLEWNQWTGLPFVFSRWMARNDLTEADAMLLEDTLYVAMEDGIDSLYHVTEPRDRILMLPKDISQYIQGLRFYMGLAERKSVDAFRGYWDQLADSRA